MALVILLRHGQTDENLNGKISGQGPVPLNTRGQEQARLAAEVLATLGVTHIFSSPVVRARQTADLLVQHLRQSDLTVEECDALAPGGSSKKLAKALRQLQAEHVALVGHEPDLGQHTAWLIGSKRANIGFAKAGVACVACDDSLRKGAGSLLWLVTPDWLGS